MKKKKTKIQLLTAENDRLYQEWGRKTYDKCIFGHNSYSCLHHYIHKSQSFNVRYDFSNGIPICNSCHCKIHQSQDSELIVGIRDIKGLAWYNSLMKRRHIPVTNKLQFLKDENIRLSNRVNKD